MPRIRQKAEEYAISDFTKKVKGKCAERGIRQNQLAAVLDISQPALSMKMQTGSYSLKEFLKIIEYLNFTDEEIVKAVK